MWVLTRATTRECIARSMQRSNSSIRRPSATAYFSVSSSSGIDKSKRVGSEPRRTERIPDASSSSSRIKGKPGPMDKWNQKNMPANRKVEQPILPKQSATDPHQISASEALLSYAKQFKHHRQDILVHLEPLPAVWESSARAPAFADEDARQRLWEETLSVLDHIRTDVTRGLLEPNRRHGSELSVLMGCALQNLAACTSSSERPVYNKCVEIMDLIKAWNLDLLHVHCEHIILAAAREGKWKEAAELFASRIDPTRGGFPVPVNVQHPIGLYCMARYAQEHAKSAVDSVMQGVMHLSILSPEDQPRYVLAAGTALGCAGEASQLVQYVQTSIHAKRLGQPLIAAAMQACLLCQEAGAAVALFDQHFTGGEYEASVQYQWGGGVGKLSPLCRDLAIRSLGFSGLTNTTQEMLKYYFKVVEDDGTLSWEAFYALLVSCEKGQREWNLAVNLLFDVLARHDRNQNFLQQDALEFPDNASSSSSSSPSSKADSFSTISDRIRALELAVHACNTSGEFGAALVCLQRFAFLHLYDTGAEEEQQQQHDTAKSFSIADILTSLAAVAPKRGEFVATCMVSLLGADCHDAARQFYEALAVEGGDVVGNYQDWGNASELSKAVDSRIVCDRNELWSHIMVDAWRLMEFKHRQQYLPIGEESRQAISLALSRLLRQCSSAENPSAGILLLTWFLDTPPTHASSPNLKELVEKIQSEETAFLVMTDSLLSAIMEAVAKQGAPLSSVELYENATRNSSTPWILSSTEAIKSLFDAEKKEEAMALFQKMLSNKTTNPDLFSSVVSKLFERGDDQGVSAVYKQALSHGCLSERLCLFEMKSVSRSVRTGKKTLHNRIAGEAILVTGDSSVIKWLEKHYWDLKKTSAGRRDIGLLLTWTDNSTADLDEIELALETIKAPGGASGSPPDIAPLQVIGQAMWKYNDQFVPSDKTRIPLVPRSKEGWYQVIQESLKLAEQTSLHQNALFMSNMAIGLHKLGYLDECVELVEACLSRGVVLHKNIMDQLAGSFPQEQATLDTVMAFYPQNAASINTASTS